MGWSVVVDANYGAKRELVALESAAFVHHCGDMAEPCLVRNPEITLTLSQRKRLLALRSVFSQKVKENNLIVVDAIQLDQPKTKAALELIATLKIDGSTLFIDAAQNRNLQFAVKNLPKAKFSTVARLNIVDALKYKKFVISKEAFNQLTQILAV